MIDDHLIDMTTGRSPQKQGGACHSSQPGVERPAKRDKANHREAQTGKAHFIGWQTSPFQKEVGFASLGFAVIGLLAFRRSFDARLAAIVGPSMFQWEAAGGHIYQMVVNHNFSPGNAGVAFWTDCFLPVIGFLLLRASYLSNQSARSGMGAADLPTNRLVTNRG
jgi:hypothetical protein